MAAWLELTLVALAVLVSALYALYALGPKRLRDIYSRTATKYFGLRAARWFAGKPSQPACHDCPSGEQARLRETSAGHSTERKS